MEVAANHEVDIFHVNLLPDNVPDLSQADLDLITELWLRDLDDAVPRPNGAENVEEDEDDSSDDDAEAHDEQDNARDGQQQPAQDADASDADRESLSGSEASEEEAPGDEHPAPEAGAERRPEENPVPQPPTPAPVPAPTTSGRSTWGSFLSGFLYPSVLLSAIASTVITPREPQVGHCVVCDEDVTSFVRVPCKDVYCITCICQLFELSTNDESLMPPRCCRTVIPLNLVTSYLRAPLRNKFRQKLEEHNTLNRLYCNKPSCGAFIGSADGPRRMVRCPTCYLWVCTSCKNDGHPGFCRQDRETENAIAFCRQQGWQRCPGCQGMIELSHGCYHMTCVCRTEFCYLCRARWKTCRCAQWDEGRLLVAAEERVRDEMRRAVPNPVPPPRPPVVNQPIQRAEPPQLVNRLPAVQAQRPQAAPVPIQFGQINGNQPMRPGVPVYHQPFQYPARPVQNNNQPAQRAGPQAIVPPVIPRPLVVPNAIRPAHNNQPVQPARPVIVVPPVGVRDQVQRPLVVPNPVRPVQNNQPVQPARPVIVAPPVGVRDQVQRPLVVPNPVRPAQNNNNNQPIQRAMPVTPPVPVARRPVAVPNPAPIRPAQNNNQPIQRVVLVPPAAPQARRTVVVPNPIQPTSRRARDQMARQVAPPPQAADIPARVRAMMDHLRENHECEHPGWYTERGAAKCETCFHRLDKFILRCRRCRTRACVRCRRNRL